MCSRPSEFINKATGDVVPIACRSCNECLSARKAAWVCRAMMEKASHEFALSVTLTYSNDTQAGRDASLFFNYDHIRLFLARLRIAASRAGFDRPIRFLCCGEQGSLNGRCHWHLILFSDADLTQIGEFYGLGEYGSPMCLEARGDIVSVQHDVKRLRWSMWVNESGSPWGFVTVQDADQSAMSYVLKYVLKDQFTLDKSRGTMREHKAEKFATGFFRMSKRPAIGELFFWERLQRFADAYSLPPSLNIKVPDMRGYYHPSGGMRRKYLWALHSLNKWIAWQTGSDAGAFHALNESVNEFDRIILNGSQKEQQARVWDEVYAEASRYGSSALAFEGEFTDFDSLPY